jgi:SP family sugar:H+ symporter-like MFS transporter
MIAVFQFWTSIGVLIGTLVDNATHKIDGKNAYMIPLGIIYVVPVFMSVGLFFIPESPRWLLYKDKNEEGLKSLMWMRPRPEAVPEEMADIQAAILAEKELSSSANFIDILKNPVDRRRTLLAVAAISTQAASGAMFMIGECSLLFVFLQVSFLLKFPSIWNILLRDGEGRQRLPELMYSNCRWRYCDHREQLCHLQDRSTPCLPHGRHVHLRRLPVHRSCCVPRQSRYSRHWKGKPSLLILLDRLTSAECIILTFIQVVVALSVIYICGYNGMVATYAWLAGGEIPSQRLRSYTFGIAAAVGFAGAWLATFTAPYFINPSALNWGPEYGTLSRCLYPSSYPSAESSSANVPILGWIWGPSCMVTVIWIYIYLPEIKNRTLEEIDEMFEAKLPARSFRKYVCVGRHIPEDKLGRKSTEEQVWGNEKAVAEATLHIE